MQKRYVNECQNCRFSIGNGVMKARVRDFSMCFKLLWKFRQNPLKNGGRDAHRRNSSLYTEETKGP
jgi:hypothetical protein